MVEADLSTKEKSLPGEESPLAEKKPQDVDHRLEFRTTDSFGADCRELSQKLGCTLETLVGDILSAGYKSIKVLSNGNKQAAVSIKDHKIVVEGLKNSRD